MRRFAIGAGLALILLLAVLGLAAGCNGRSLPATDGSVADTRHDQSSAREALRADLKRLSDSRPSPPPGPNDCIIAIRVDDCCTQPMPAFVQSLKTDPCLVPYPIKLPILPECIAKQPKKCEVIDCANGVPRSRLVAAIPGGSCNWMDECQTDADCITATNYAVPVCCPCAYGYPKQLQSTNSCLLHACLDYQPCPPPPCPAPLGCGMPCVGCPTGPVVCQKASPTDPDAKNRCLPWNPW